jgi:putative PIN family toxin of toxin-antitoxin system
MIRAVFDTNILISGVLYSGKPSRLIDLVVDGEIQLVSSVEIIQEFSEVVARPKFNLSKEEHQLFTNFIIRLSTITETKSKFKVVEQDPDDDMVVISAFDGKAAFIVSGDPHLLKLKEVLGIRILTANQMLKMLGKL